MSEDVKRDGPAAPEGAAAKASSAPIPPAPPSAFGAKPSDKPAADKTSGEKPPAAAPPPDKAAPGNIVIEKSVPQARPRRFLAGLALIVALLALAVAVIGIAGPRAILFAERQFPRTPWIEPIGKLLNPGWSVDAAEFDRRVNLLEGVLAKSQPGAVSRQDVVDLLLGRFEGRRATEVRDEVEALKRGMADLAGRLPAERQAAEARAAQLDSSIKSLAESGKSVTEANSAKLADAGRAIEEIRGQIAAAGKAIEETRGQVAATGKAVEETRGQIAATAKTLEETRGQVTTLAPVADRSAKNEADLAALAKRLDQVAGGLDELKNRAAGPERLLVAVLQLQVSSQTGRAFAGELRLVKQTVPPNSPMGRIAETLTIPAQRGAPTVSDLRDQFGTVAEALVQRGARESRNWFERVGANVKGTLSGIGLTLPPPLTPAEAAVMETQRQLANGNLLAALTEIQTLDGRVRSLASAWITQAQLRLAIDQAVADIANAALEAASKAP